MSRPRVLITDSPFPSADPFLEELRAVDADVVLAPDPKAETIVKLGRDADGIIVTYAEMTADVVRQLQKCRVMARTGVGMNNIDVPAATAAGIYCTNIATPQVEDVANHAILMMMALAKKLVPTHEWVQSGHWDFSVAVPVHRLSGQTFGLLGFGNIARTAAKRALAFDMKVIGYDPFIPEEAFKAMGARKVELEELFAESDFLSLHTPLLPETQKIIRKESLAKMKPTAFLINTARGGLVDEEALVEALDAGRLAGAGLDVLQTEFPGSTHPLLGRPNVIITPHSAYYSIECVDGLQRGAAREVVRVLSGQKPESLFNRDVVPR